MYSASSDFSAIIGPHQPMKIKINEFTVGIEVQMNYFWVNSNHIWVKAVMLGTLSKYDNS